MKILNIEEIEEGTKCENIKNKYNMSYEYQGYKITTDYKTFLLLISSEQDCCESFGHITTEEDLSKFIGKEVLDFKCIEDSQYCESELDLKAFGEVEDLEYIDVLDCAFINFTTSIGGLQFAVYNNHNGYYGHDIQIVTINTAELS